MMIVLLSAPAFAGRGGSAPAAAAGGSGAVEGDVLLPPTRVEEPGVEHPGFIKPPIKNQIVELRPFDPRPDCFVFLDGGPAEGDASKPGSGVTLNLGVAAFAAPVLPIVFGTPVVVKNVSKYTHPIFTPDADGSLENENPIGPGGDRKVVVKTANVPVHLLSRDSPHVVGRIVAMPTRYFARLSRDGAFKIDDVPPGRWTVHIWYRDGWLSTTQVVDVSAKTPRIKITLPERLMPKPQDK